MEILSYYFELSFPIKKKEIKENNNRRKPWLTRGLITSAQNMKYLYELTLSGNHEIIQYYNNYKKIYRKLLNKAKRLYNNDLICNSSNKCKTAWNIINQNGNQQNKHKNIALRMNDELVTDSQTLSNTFNEFFNSISNSRDFEQSDVITNTLNTNNNNTFYFIPATEQDILDLLSNLKNTSSPDIMINSTAIKTVKELLVKPLTYLINNSLQEGIFPDCLKTAKISPIHKSGDVSSIQNFRPISQLSPIAKVYEKYVADCIIKYFDKYNLFNKNQYGFRKNKSTNDAIIQFINMLLQNLDKGNKVLGIFVDLSKAFDTVHHGILLEKLERYGFRGVAYNWMNSYLHNRKHFVEIGHKKSEILMSSKGVPQGSVLGPILYIIYVNDFPLTNSIMYADDTSIIISDTSNENVCKKASREITSTQHWFSQNHLHLNETKTHFMQFTHSNNATDSSLLIKSQGKSIQQVPIVKFLGVQISESCKWGDHINTLCKRLSSVSYSIYKLKLTVDKPVLMMYYHAHFHSIMSYAISSWGISSSARRIFKIQKRVIRIIESLCKRESCRNSFTTLNVLTMPCEYIYKTLVYVKTNIMNFQPLSSNAYNTRNHSILEIPKHNLTATEQNPIYMGIKLFNKLNLNMRKLHISRFKKEVKQMLQKKAYYSINEYFED